MSTDAATPTTAPPPSDRARRLTDLVLRMRELGIVAVLLLLIGVTAVLEPRFIEIDSLRDLALNASIFAILAVGPDPGHRHPQHRPVGQLGARAVGLPRG